MADTNTTNYSTITSDALKPETKMLVPNRTPDTTPYESIIQGALTSLPTVTSQVEQAQRDSESILSRVIEGGKDMANKEQFSQDQQNLAGVNDRQKELDVFNAQFNDLGAQISGLARSSQAVPLLVQEKNLGTGATDRGVAPQEAGMLRKNAIQALTLASEADVLGAQITNAEARLNRAKEKAQQAVDLKYKPIEAEQARLKELLDLNMKYVLEPAEKKKLEAVNIALGERTRLLQEKKEDEKNNMDLIINANSQGAPKDVIANARALVAKGAKPEAVATALGAYAGDYIGTQLKLKQMKLADLEYKIKNNELIQSTLPPIAQNADGTVVKGTGANATDRNVNTLEAIIKRNAKAIPDGTQTQIANTLGVINSIKELVSTNTDGKFSGQYPMAGVINWFTPDALKRKETINNEALIGGIELKVQQWASGASLTEKQTELVQGMVPKKGDTDNVIRQKLNSLTDLMNSQASAQLTSAGIKFRPEKADYFDNSLQSKVKNAVGSGYGAKEIVDNLAQSPEYQSKVTEARKAGYTDEQIVTYLQQ